MGGTGSPEEGSDTAEVVHGLRYALRNRWRCGVREVPCVLDGRVGSAQVAPGTILFVEHKRGPLGIKYVVRSTGWVQVDSVDRGTRGGEVRIGTRSYEWSFRHADHARWAFDVVEMPRDSFIPRRPPRYPSPKWLDYLADD